MASQRQMMIKIERMFRQITEQNDAILEMLESRLPKKKKAGRPKTQDEIIEPSQETPTEPTEQGNDATVTK